MPQTSTILADIKGRAAAQRGKPPRDAVDFIYMSTDEIFDTPFADVEQIQLATLKARFESLMEKIGPLRQLAAQQDIHKIGRLEDAAPLLFGPKVHKSYPLSLLEGNHFDKLTQWLGRLTTHDLSRIDVSGCDTIDGWLDRLEAQTPMLVMHSSGTSGKLSIIPRSHIETCHHVEMWFKFMDGYRREYGGDIRALNGTLPIFLPTYRQGRHVQRAMEIAYPAICGSEEHFICAFPGKLSADLLTLGGRLAAAEAKGEQGRLTLNPALLEQRERMLEFQRRVPEFMDAFFGKMLEYRGRRVMFVGTWVSLLQATLAGEKRGIQGLFAADSFSITGGGKKGTGLSGRLVRAHLPLLRCAADARLLWHDRNDRPDAGVPRAQVPPMASPGRLSPGSGIRQVAAARGRAAGPLRLHGSRRRDALGRRSQR